jgi:hypothetical protein
MLKLNLELKGANGEAVGYDEDEERLYLRARILEGDDLTGKLLAGWFTDYATFAKGLNDEMESGRSMQAAGDVLNLA